MKLPAKHGFTLIELLISIGIAGVLATIGIVVFSSSQKKAKEMQVKIDFRKIVSIIELARMNRPDTLRDMTGSNCTDCSCRLPSVTDVRNSDACKTTVKTSWDKIASLAMQNVSMLYDPWGNPYVWDENEREFAGTPCATDVLRSAGPDHQVNTADDYLRCIYPITCKLDQVAAWCPGFQ